MKKLILGGLILLAYSNTQAQEKTKEQYGFNKGDITISGVISYSNQNSNSYSTRVNQDNYEFKAKSNSLTIIPEIGHFVTNHIMTGIKAGYILANIDNGDINSYNYNRKTNGFNTSIFGRYYFSPKKRISLFIELDTGYEYRKSRSKRTDISPLETGENINKNYFISASSGINIFINKKFSLTSRIGKLGYSYTKNKYQNSGGNTSNDKSNRFNANLGLSNFYFGISYRI